MSNTLNNAPVYFTVVQIQFNALTNLSEFMSAIQPRFRSLGYPDFKEEMVQQIVLSANVGAATPSSPVTVTHKKRYRFGDIAGSGMYILEENAMSFHTTAHETFIDLSKNFFGGLNVVHDVMKLDLSDRIGMRYLNAVMPSENEALEKYLQPQVLGLSKQLGGTLQHSIHETVTSHGGAQLVSRVVLMNGKVGLPAEMTGQVINLKPQFSKFEGLHAILDADAYEIARAAFNINDLTNKLSYLHDLIHKTFNVTVTPGALKDWA
jgi:uncharacterized protein (TIGR04255 family)